MSSHRWVYVDGSAFAHCQDCGAVLDLEEPVRPVLPDCAGGLPAPANPADTASLPVPTR